MKVNKMSTLRTMMIRHIEWLGYMGGELSN